MKHSLRVMVNDPAKIAKKISTLSINNNLSKGEGDILAGSTNPKKNSSLPNKKGIIFSKIFLVIFSSIIIDNILSQPIAPNYWRARDKETRFKRETFKSQQTAKTRSSESIKIIRDQIE